MTDSQSKLSTQLQRSQSEKRERAHVIEAKAEPTADETAELTRIDTELQALEPDYRAALTAVETEQAATVTATADTEVRERVRLRGKAKLGDFLTALLSGRDLTGATLEYREAFGDDLPLALEGGIVVPLDLWESGRVEKRAITPGAAAENMPLPTSPYVFQRSVADSLGVQFPIVASGAANFVTVTTPPPAGDVAKGHADAPITAGALALVTRNPARVSGAFEVRREDIAVMSSLESDLLMALGGAVRNETDITVISDLFTVATNVNAASAVETFPTGVARFAALVDGQYSDGMGSLRGIVGSVTFARYAGQFTADGSVSLYDYLASKMASLRVSNRVPAVASNAQKALVTRGTEIAPIRVPVWGGVEIVTDPYSNSRKGQIRITAISLIGTAHVPHTTSQVIEVHPKLS